MPDMYKCMHAWLKQSHAHTGCVQRSTFKESLCREWFAAFHVHGQCTAIHDKPCSERTVTPAGTYVTHCMYAINTHVGIDQHTAYIHVCMYTYVQRIQTVIRSRRTWKYMIIYTRSRLHIDSTISSWPCIYHIHTKQRHTYYIQMINFTLIKCTLDTCAVPSADHLGLHVHCPLSWPSWLPFLEWVACRWRTCTTTLSASIQTTMWSLARSPSISRARSKPWQPPWSTKPNLECDHFWFCMCGRLVRFPACCITTRWGFLVWYLYMVIWMVFCAIFVYNYLILFGMIL